MKHQKVQSHNKKPRIFLFSTSIFFQKNFSIFLDFFQNFSDYFRIFSDFYIFVFFNVNKEKSRPLKYLQYNSLRILNYWQISGLFPFSHVSSLQKFFMENIREGRRPSLEKQNYGRSQIGISILMWIYAQCSLLAT